jgi:hypothetical protein
MKNILNSLFLLLVTVLLINTSCNKTNEYPTITPNSEVHFVGTKNQTYQLLSAAQPVYNVVVGSTDVSNSDRTFTYKVSSTSGAIGGTHYSIASGNTTGTLTIPAGQALANIPVQGLYAPYNATGRKDTIVFSLTEPSLKAAAFSDTVKLVLRGPCFETDILMPDLLGNYANTRELFGTSAYGPYLTKITVATITGPSAARITVTNIWDNGWGPIQFDLDWSNPFATTATVVPQNAIAGSNAGDLNATYAGQTIAVRAPSAALAGTAPTYSYCLSKFTLKMQLGVTNVGFFNTLYTVNMAR